MATNRDDEALTVSQLQKRYDERKKKPTPSAGKGPQLPSFLKSVRQEEVDEAKERIRSYLEEAKKEKTLKNTNPCWDGYEPVGTKKKGGRTVPNCVPKEEVELMEKAPPGAKYERMVKHIKKSLKGKPRATEIAFATAWKQYNKKTQNEEYISEKARGTRPKRT